MFRSKLTVSFHHIEIRECMYIANVWLKMFRFGFCLEIVLSCFNRSFHFVCGLAMRRIYLTIFLKTLTVLNLPNALVILNQYHNSHSINLQSL